MRFDIVTIFPEFFRGPLEHGIVRRAQDAGLVEIHVQDLREFTRDRHRTVDDRPFGGGEGMVLKPEPLFEAVEHLLGRAADVGVEPRVRPMQDGQSRGSAPTTAIVLLSASGKLFRQEKARQLAQLERVVLLCGRYEGVDERVAEHLATDELSIGDFVLSGGELPAAMVVDAVTRLIPGALGNEDSTANESFSGSSNEMAEVGLGFNEQDNRPLQAMALLSHLGLSRGILDFPHYTRPAEFRGWKVPEVLISGNHAEVARWRHRMALLKTVRNRPELLAGARLSETDYRLLEEMSTLADPEKGIQG